MKGQSVSQAAMSKLPHLQIPKSPGNIKPVGIGRQYAGPGPVPDPGGNPNHFTYRDLRLISHDNPITAASQKSAVQQYSSPTGLGQTPQPSNASDYGYTL